MKPQFALATLIAACFSTITFAQSENPPGFDVALITFQSIDLDGDGFANIGDMNEFGISIFEGMDYDGDEKVTFSEFSDWDIGFELAAQEVGRPEAIVTARRIMFGMWDANNDGNLTMAEKRRAGMLDFNRADVDDNSLLDEREFLIGYSVNVVMRSAINPDLAAPNQQ
ncbi:MAG: hypothetical protein AAGG69_12415 [Pseudomonadota bacterium]